MLPDRRRLPLLMGDTIVIWCCPECGHWTGSSYMQATADNPTWRPKCKIKGDGCSRPEMNRVVVEVLDSGVRWRMEAANA